MEKMIKENKIIAIIRGIPYDKTINYVEAIYNGGIKLLEIALNSDDALKQIELVRSRFEDKIMIGAGTAITKPLAHDAISAGAQFLLTPSTNPEILEFSRINNVPLLPGVMTPSDVDTCLRYGFNTLKLFPAGDLPETYIKSLKGPFSNINYVAVGGVNVENIGSFFSRGFIGVGIGSNLIPSGFVKNNQWEEASQHVCKLIENIKESA